jgi:hypothetical protein
MQISLNPKEVYAANAQATRAKPSSVAAMRDRQIIDRVTLSGKDRVAEKKHTGHATSVDRVDLSAGLSVDEVNQLLEKEVGRKVREMLDEAGIEPTALADRDWSPEATAERIFRGTTGLFEIWKSQHRDMSEEELIDSFEHVLRASVDRGATEAIGLIEARKFESEDTIVDTARETIGLVHEKFDSYFKSLREGSKGNNSSEKNEIPSSAAPSRSE